MSSLFLSGSGVLLELFGRAERPFIAVVSLKTTPS